ncbi:hypothetical protein [Flagellimonas crocea]|uniref:hypothetical protein n=1 Tax=Flagellimonas crocea TaxID=3067311 RepID=UPI00296FFDDB|nr:hypothetical protein [Muricauda sp. DH64]
MKNLIILTVWIQGQEKLFIDLNKEILNQEILVESTEYELEILSNSSIVIEEVLMRKNASKYKPLVWPPTESDSIKQFNKQDESIPLFPKKLKFNDNTEYTFLFKIEKDGSEQTRKYIFKSQSDWDWSSTFGINAVFLLNSDTYKTIADGETFQIVGDQGQNIIDYVPSIMFSFMNLSKNWAFGPSAGLGFDLEQVSIFGGYSMMIGQNFVFTAGVAFHSQERLDSKYFINDTVDASLSFDELHEKYYRFNPFVSLSLKLDKKPF